jgi:hypothetical protein
MSTIKRALREMVPGSKMYRRVKGSWHREDVVRVTKVTIVLRDETRVSKVTSKDKEGRTWFPSTPGMVELYEAQEVRPEAQVETGSAAYEAALGRLQAVAKRATPAELRDLATQLENLIDRSGLE